MVKVAIFHEGNAKKTVDNELLKLLLKELNLDINSINFIGMGTKSNFFKIDNDNYKELAIGIKSEAIEKVLFVIDADYEKNDSKYGGFQNTKRELESIIKKLEIEENSDIFITCDPKRKDGYLESLILSSIPQNQKECIEDFLSCSNFTSKDNHKSILNQIYKTAYPQAPFDFSHQNFDILKKKLKDLFDG